MRILPIVNNSNQINKYSENNLTANSTIMNKQVSFASAASSASKASKNIFVRAYNAVQEAYGKWILQSKNVRKFSKWLYSKDTTNATKHFAVVGSLATSTAYAYNTLKSKKLEKKNSRTLAVNQALNFLVPTVLGYTLDSLIAGHTKEIEYKFAAKLQRALDCSHLSSEEYDKALVRATKQIKGVRTLAGIATFTLLYRYLAPVAITPLANRIGEWLGKKQEEKPELKVEPIKVRVL